MAILLLIRTVRDSEEGNLSAVISLDWDSNPNSLTLGAEYLVVCSVFFWPGACTLPPRLSASCLDVEGFLLERVLQVLHWTLM
jgi:hypothetical protein